MKQIRAGELEAEMLRHGYSAMECAEAAEAVIDTYGTDAWLGLCHPSQLPLIAKPAGAIGCLGVLITVPLVVVDWPELLEEPQA